MIQKVIDFLFEQLELPNKNQCSMNIIVRKPYLLHLHLVGGRSIVVKIVELIDTCIQENLQREYFALSEQSKLYPGLVPIPILYRHVDHLVILAMEGAKHSFVSLRTIFCINNDTDHNFRRFLIGRERIDKLSLSFAEEHIAVFNKACSLLSDDLESVVSEIREKNGWDKILASLPYTPQHCDMTMNNIGLTRTGLILFDWENYAFINIPGFDLCTILVSGCQFSLLKLTATIDNNIQSFLQPIIDSFGITVSQFYDLIFIHLILFYQLKNQHGYSQEVIQRTENMLIDLSKYMLK